MRIRLTFRKGGALRYTGHLDLHKLWERSFRRAGLPLAYSQGYHPQPKIQLAAALPLGFSARAELLDVWTNSEVDLQDLPEMLARSIPIGLEILGVEQVDEHAPALQTEVQAAEYRVKLKQVGEVPDLVRRVADVLNTRSLPRERRGKPYDLRPLIEELRVTDENEIFMRLSAREGATGRPEEVLAVLDIPFEETNIERTALVLGQGAPSS